MMDQDCVNRPSASPGLLQRLTLDDLFAKAGENCITPTEFSTALAEAGITGLRNVLYIRDAFYLTLVQAKQIAGMRRDEQNILCSQHKTVMKVAFTLDSLEWHGQKIEMMWTRFLVHDRYRLLNVPFYVAGVSQGDVVVAKPEQKGGLPVFQRISHRGGHSTYRIFESQDAMRLKGPKTADLWHRLQEAGCTYEGTGSRLIVIDVAPKADILSVYRILVEGEEAGVWDFAEGHCGHQLDGRFTNRAELSIFCQGRVLPQS